MMISRTKPEALHIKGRIGAKLVKMKVFPSQTGYMLNLFIFLGRFEMYSTYSSKMIGNFPKLLHSNRLYFKLDWLNL
jgi:hypothetical protein